MAPCKTPQCRLNEKALWDQYPERHPSQRSGFGLLCAIALKLQRKCEVAALQRDVAWTSAVLWIAQTCHSSAMAPPHKSRRQRAAADAPLDDLYDYVAAPARPGRRRANRASVTLTVTDNWPEDVPVTEAEIAVFEAWFGELFDELFGDG